MTDKRRTTIFPARPRPEAVSKTEATGATQAETPASVASPANASPANASPNNAPPADLPAIEASANVAPDAILTDATLKEMARKRPLLMTDMEEISGMGEEKLNKYGRVFIETIKGCLNLE